MPEITLCVTSCGRHDLLDRTLRSFAQFNTYPIKETIFVEDSDLGPPEWLADLPGIGPKQWIANGARKGQVYSIDRAYAEVSTPYIFHCEDDWEFLKSGFIEASLELLERSPRVWTVSLRGSDCNGHEVEFDQELGINIHVPYWREGWGGFHWNPGLRRMADYRRIGSYGRHLSYDPRITVVGELDLSRHHLDNGYRIAVLD